MPMEITYSLTPEDIIAFQEYHHAHPPVAPGKSRWSGLLWVVVLFGLIAALAFIGDDKRQGNQLLLTLLILFAILVVLAPITWLLQKVSIKKRISKSVRQMLKEGNNARVLEPFRISITPEGLQYTGA